MLLKAVFFDLDGTLLPMDMDEFTNGYFKMLTKKIAPLGYDPQEVIKAIWTSVGAMVKNDGKLSNEEAFWQKFATIYGEKGRSDKYAFDEFYANEFDEAKIFCGKNEELIKLVHKIKERGFRVILATNPLFPAVATEARIRWAGFEPSDFEFFTTYENINYCKPNPKYYEEVVRRAGLEPSECLMIGNDALEDMIAETIGMKVFLLTDCLINKEGKDISVYAHGGVSDLSKYLQLD